MRKLFIIILILAAVGCSRQNDYNPRLLDIERSSESNPTASLQKLEDLRPALTTSADSMLYVLLYSETARAMGMTFDNEDWIRPAVSYFDSIEDRPRAVRSMLMLALCYYDDGQFDKAAEWLVRTRECDGGANPLLRYQLYLTLGDINKMVGRQNEKMSDYHNAYQAAVDGGDKERQTTALYRLAVSYFDKGSADSLKAVCGKLDKAVGKTGSDSTLTRTAHGMLWLLEKDTVKASRLLLEAQAFDVDCRASSLLAGILYSEGNVQEADNLWLIAANSQDRDIAIDAISHLIDDAESMSYKLELSQSLNKLYADKPTAEEVAKVIEVQNKLDEMASEGQNHRRIIALLIAVGVLFVVIAVIVAFILWRKWQRKKEEQSWNIERDLLNSELVSRLHGLAAKGNKMDAEMQRDVDELISDHDPRLTSLLHRNNDLSAADRHVVQLIRLRFQPSEIAVLMDLSPQRVTNARSRLLQRIFNEKGGAKEFDKRIRDLK